MAVSAGIPRLERDLVAAYLRRLGVDCEPMPTAEALARLQRAHLRRVPFENLDIHLGVPIELDARGFAEKIALRDRGGFCYELNGAFASLLAELGFHVELPEARVHSPGGLGGRFGHLCLAVQIGDRRLLVDVGFGRSGSDEPILLEPDVAQADTAGAFVLRDAAEGTLDMLRDGLPEYRVALTGRALADFEPGCRFHQTSPDSPFTRTIVCTLRTAHGRVTLAGTRLIETSSRRQAERELDRSAFARVLATTCGVRLGDAAIDRLMARRRPGRRRAFTARGRPRAQPWMMLCTGATLGCPGSTPRSPMIGSSVAPKASNDSWDSQTSNTWTTPSLSSATW